MPTASFRFRQALKFFSDGSHCVAGLNLAGATLRTYLWGADRSGSLTGAGGAGGRVAVNRTANGVRFGVYDGKGNLTGLVKAAAGSISARYECGPFGEVLRVTGTMGTQNSFAFSTKFTDLESGLLYYGYRDYSPSLGKLLNRDPLGELAFQRTVLNRESSIENRLQAKKANVFENQEHLAYVLVGNDPSDKIDLLGLVPCNACGRAAEPALQLTPANVASRFSKLV